MTREDAITILKQPDRIGCNLIKANDEESTKYNQESIEALGMAIKALEQQPNDDCVSRQAVLDATVKKNSIWKSITNSKGENLEEIISQLPSVTPTRKKGKWVNDPYEDFLPHCSNCDSAWSYAENMNYCPTCGAEMRGNKE